MARSIQERAAELAERIARRQGCELVHCDYLQETGGWHLRVFISSEDAVTMEDCVAVSRQLSTALDVEDFIPHSYNLEVSSPGIDRPLRGLQDYVRNMGKRVRVKTAAPVRGRRRFRGNLGDVDGEVLRIQEPGGQCFEIPLERVSSARLDPEL
ncbi:MAG: ribosome maturation factor RimP [Acidobacteriota bacterium]